PRFGFVETKSVLPGARGVPTKKNSAAIQITGVSQRARPGAPRRAVGREVVRVDEAERERLPLFHAYVIREDADVGRHMIAAKFRSHETFVAVTRLARDRHPKAVQMGRGFESVPRVTDQHAVLDRTHADVSALEGCTDEIFHHVEVRIPAESKKLRFRECFVFAITRRGEDRPDGERSSRDPAKPETEMPVQAGHDERVYRADVSPATGRFAKIGKS